MYKKQNCSSVEDPSNNEQVGADIDHERRDVLRAFAKYSGAVGVTSFAVLTADEALAKLPCSVHPNPNSQNCDP